MDENEIIKNRKDIIDLFDGYDLYIVDCASINKEDKIINTEISFEKEFGVTIPDEAAEEIATVGDAIAYIENKLK